MRDLNGQSNPLLSGRSRGSTAGTSEVPQLLPHRRRGFGLPVALGISTTAIALAGYLVVSELSGGHEADLPPASSRLEVARTSVESFTGSLAGPTAKERGPIAAASLAASPSRDALPARTPDPTPARLQADQSLGSAAPAASDQARAPVSVVASAGVVTALPSSLPASAAPAVSQPPAGAPPAPQAVPMAAPAPRGPSPAETAAFVNRARELIRTGDIAGARLLLEHAAAGEDGPALLALAETYDPSMLAQWSVRGVMPNAEKAKALYQKAAEHGVAAAHERMLALR